MFYIINYSILNSPNHNPVTGIQRAVLVDATSQIASTELRFVTEKLTSICPEVIVNLERGIATSAISRLFHRRHKF